MIRVAVVLSGCGCLDGSEIHEAVLALSALDRAGAKVTIAAPDVEFPAIDHQSGKSQSQTRSSLVEAARIARGKIALLSTLRESDFDALVMPGGEGAAKNLCDFETMGEKARVHPDVARFMQSLWRAKKPIGAICIAPAIVAAVLRDQGARARLTLGNDPDMAQTLRAMGQEAVDCDVDQCIVDEEQRIVCTPGYMYDARIADVAAGIERLVTAVIALDRARASGATRATR
jgi:enhancing lycopene biosynthesis protein 2